MIGFKEEQMTYEAENEGRSATERLKLLEKILRQLGNFPVDQDIIIINSEYLGNYDKLYEVRDLEDTSFTFYNYNLGSLGDNHRFNQNYYLNMKRKGNSFTYVYDFYPSKVRESEFEVIEISRAVSDKRKLRILESHHYFNRLVVQEEEKKYLVIIKPSKEEKLIQSLETITQSLQSLDTLNLENILNLLDRDDILTVSIYIDDELRADISFSNGKINRYKIEESNQVIEATIGDQISRKVEREIEVITRSKEKIKTESSDPQLIKSDLGRLLKQI